MRTSRGGGLHPPSWGLFTPQAVSTCLDKGPTKGPLPLQNSLPVAISAAQGARPLRNLKQLAAACWSLRGGGGVIA